MRLDHLLLPVRLSHCEKELWVASGRAVKIMGCYFRPEATKIRGKIEHEILMNRREVPK